MNYTYTKEKNYINFTKEEDTKPYKFDINTGIFYGKTGKPLQNFPTGFMTWFKDNRYGFTSNVLNMANKIANNTYNYGLGWSKITIQSFTNETISTMLIIADKLEAIGYILDNNRVSDYDVNTLKFVNENFKMFAKKFKADNHYSVGQFRTDYEIELFKQSFVKSIEIYHLTDEMVKSMYNHKDMLSSERYGLVANYLARGLWDFYDCGHITRYGNNNTDSMFEKIKSYFKMCDEMGIEPEKDFLKSYVAVHRDYLVMKEQKDDSILVNKAKELHAKLDNFSDDIYEIVIPTSSELFLDEAHQQNNCVYAYYLPRVLNDETTVVFIRKKNNPTKSYITCEITNRGNINQFYLVNNTPVEYGTEDYQFKRKLEMYLNNNW